tara:strand:+ start:76 stop:924 length:849 start_codon:yes stop_codon:yes gene_type:complete
MTVIIKYPEQNEKTNKEFFLKKEKELTNLDWAKWAGWFDTDGSFSSYVDKRNEDKKLQYKATLKLADRQPVELFSETFDVSLCYSEWQTITPEPYRNKYTAKIYNATIHADKSHWFTENVYPYLLKEEKKKFASELLGYTPKSKTMEEWTEDEVIHYLATVIDGDGYVQVSKGRQLLSLVTVICSIDPQYLANLVALGANRINLNSKFKKKSEHLTKRGWINKYILNITCSKRDPHNFNFFESLLKDNVMTLDRKKEKIQKVLDSINLDKEKFKTKEMEIRS